MKIVRKIKEKSGETLVEVMVSMVIFLLMLSMMQGAILFSNASLKKSKEIREDNTKIMQGLLNATEETVKPATLKFQAVSADGQTLGNQVFDVPVSLNQKRVNYQDASGKESSVVFYLYGESKTANATDTTETTATTESTGGSN